MLKSAWPKIRTDLLYLCIKVELIHVSCESTQINIDVVNLPPMYEIHIQSSLPCAVLFLLRERDEVALKHLYINGT